jgi:hypothetical protein
LAEQSKFFKNWSNIFDLVRLPCQPFPLIKPCGTIGSLYPIRVAGRGFDVRFVSICGARYA